MSDEPTKIIDNGDGKLDRLLSMVSDLSALVGSIDSRLSSLEQKVEERLYDTRPLWEGVGSQLTELKTEVEKGFRTVARRLDVISGDINQVRADLHDHESRLEGLERKNS
jgi:hypothetical protein